MNGFAFELGGVSLRALPNRALWWPDQNVLCVSDLHLGKAERLARRGGSLLPPFEVDETLGRLDEIIAELAPRHVICLGDSFDDDAAGQNLDERARLWLIRQMAGRRWTWIIGNHDPGPVDLGGEYLLEVAVGPLIFRHIAEQGARNEVSGHYHPKVRAAGIEPSPAFVVDTRRLVLPAFGTYTGGLDARHPSLRSLFDPICLAITTGRRALPIPI